MHHPEHYRPIVDFIAGTGLAIIEEALPADTFLPGIMLRDGGLVIDPAKLLWPGDLLHEAGHLAVLPAGERARANDALVDTTQIEYAGESEAMAWAYAAAKAIGLPLEILIHEGGYQGRSADVLSMYAFGVYPGLRGLCEIGLTAAPGFTPECGEVRYPHMLRWLRA
jgi:hypothetical protein